MRRIKSAWWDFADSQIFWAVKEDVQYFASCHVLYRNIVSSWSKASSSLLHCSFVFMIIYFFYNHNTTVCLEMMPLRAVHALMMYCTLKIVFTHYNVHIYHICVFICLPSDVSSLCYWSWSFFKGGGGGFAPLLKSSGQGSGRRTMVDRDFWTEPTSRSMHYSLPKFRRKSRLPNAGQSNGLRRTILYKKMSPITPSTIDITIKLYSY